MAGREYCVAVSGPLLYRGDEITISDHPIAFSALERKLESSEKIFTSMDRKSISEDRIIKIKEDKIKNNLYEIAYKIFERLQLKSIVRIDLRADENGELNVLEANPKPDLKMPSEKSASLVALGLSENNLSYCDLMKSLLAGSIYDYIKYRPRYIKHIIKIGNDV